MPKIYLSQLQPTSKLSIGENAVSAYINRLANIYKDIVKDNGDGTISVNLQNVDSEKVQPTTELKFRPRLDVEVVHSAFVLPNINHGVDEKGVSSLDENDLTKITLY